MKVFVFLVLAGFCALAHSDTTTFKPQDEDVAETSTITTSIHTSTEENRKLIANFFREFLQEKNIDSLDKYVAPNVIQHKPDVADGLKALKSAAKIWFSPPNSETIEVLRIAADGDLVWYHTKKNRNGKILASVDIMRVENGLIAEHWSVLQALEEKSANDHPLF